MPQMVPYYFLSNISFILCVLIMVVYCLYKYILPQILLMMGVREELSKGCIEENNDLKI